MINILWGVLDGKYWKFHVNGTGTTIPFTKEEMEESNREYREVLETIAGNIYNKAFNDNYCSNANTDCG